jgi:hypothetical protein
LQEYGTVPHRGATLQTGNNAQIQVEEYYLNESQALLLCMKSAAPQAKYLIDRLTQIRAWQLTGH